ncbi:PglL family O-oligosaccharyltransferase [Undibacterium macrobrachii]|jgi:O-antigen ligase|uniref:PglL family O-oligosaccharyltransferase n=1 Tax=Undibacterium macrobrachii TaxID=1119058 RepID=UPI001675253B|nr:O-antigen ligase family protein [Undibacterium macrobrachii]
MFLKNITKLSIILFGLCLLFAQLYSGHIHPYRSFYHEFAVVVGVFLALIPLFVFSREKLIVPAIAGSALLLFSFLGLQSLLGLTLLTTIYYPLFLLFCTALAKSLGASWVKLNGNADDLCQMFAVVYLLAAVLSVLMQQLQIMGIDWRPIVMYMSNDGVNPIRAFANVAQPNQLALLICFGFAALWWLLESTRLPGKLAWCVAVFLLWGLALTQSRIGWIILPSLFVLIVYLRKTNAKLSLLGMLSLLVIYASLVITLPTIAKYLGFVVGTLGERLGGRSERSVLLQQAWAIASAHPWLGAGWFGFGAQQVAVAADFSSTIYAEHSHNIVLNFAAELGLPFTILFFGILFVWFWKHFALREAHRDKSKTFILMMLLAVGVHSMVEFPLWYAYVLLPVGLMMGAAHQLQQPQAAWQISRGWVQASIAICFAILAFAWVDYHRVVNGFVAFRQTKDYALIPKEKIQAPRWTLMPDYFDYFKLLLVTPRSGMSPEEIQFVITCSHRFGYVHILDKLAQVYVLNNQVDAAKRVMQSLQRLHPIVYPEYYDYWQSLAKTDERYAAVFATMPARNAP